MVNTINVLCVYFKHELAQLTTNYHWKIPNIDGFAPVGTNNYQQNVELKHHFHQRWSQAVSVEEKVSIAKDVIAKWGGVRNNKTSTLEIYIERVDGLTATDSQSVMPLQGVASYSKLYSIVNMERFAIYDARVAACLNAVQFNSSVKDGTVFNYIPGRNNVVGHAGKKIGFAHQPEFSKKALLEKGWKSVSRNDTYKVYLSTLNTCLTILNAQKTKGATHNLHDLEMVLFANAETECSKAIDTARRSMTKAA